MARNHGQWKENQQTQLSTHSKAQEANTYFKRTFTLVHHGGALKSISLEKGNIDNYKQLLPNAT